ncbi:hypothetical protein [Brachybacterium avium]|uniref:hypothetical protein n=1 Tax=Brachybacterium avium TaxID=2017485 RepID=UPI001FE8EC4E|nr:hypothetical protein [Brachybacterium avium]
MELVATWFDTAQLAVIDETEPNYDRLRLSTDQFPLRLATGQQPPQFDVYASHRGVLAEDDRPIPLRHRQQEMFDELVGLTGSSLTHGDAAEVCAALAAAPGALDELVTAHGLVAPDGLPR